MDIPEELKEATEEVVTEEEEEIQQPVKKSKVTATKVRILTDKQKAALELGRQKLAKINETKKSKVQDTVHIINRIEKIETENATLRETVLKTKLQQLEEEQEVLKQIGELADPEQAATKPTAPPEVPVVPVPPSIQKPHSSPVNKGRGRTSNTNHSRQFNLSFV